MMVTNVKQYLAAFVVIAACKSDEKTKAPPVTVVTKSVGSGSATADPWAGKPPRTTPETPAEKKQRADVALARVASIMPKLAKVRELTFDHDIPREYQTTEDFRTFVHASIAKEMPKDKAAD
jgi:hypothetical protein